MLVIADSDSYVKWGAALASRLGDDWQADLVLLRTPVLPSERQLEVALSGTDFTRADAVTVRLEELDAVLDRRRPDAVLLAVRGPLVRVLAPRLVSRQHRPVLVSGFPGLTIPVADKAIVYRELVDLVVLHSRREVREFGAAAERMGVGIGFGLATLPFLRSRVTAGSATNERWGADADSAARDGELVFAVQAKVPAERADRVELLAALARAARRRPNRRVVVKVRARAGETQTHDEQYDYAELLRDPAVRAAVGGALPPNLVVEDGPMAAHLARAEALVTVSSTAVLEAVAAGVPAIVVDSFGVDDRLINTVFEGSGLFGGLDEVAEWRVRHPSTEWCDDNYFHGAGHDDWNRRLADLVTANRAAALPVPERRHNLTGGALRRAFERKRMLGREDRTLSGAVALGVAIPSRWVLRRARRIRAGATGVVGRPDARSRAEWGIRLDAVISRRVSCGRPCAAGRLRRCRECPRARHR